MRSFSRICRLAVFICLIYVATSKDTLAQQLRISGAVSDGSGVVPDASVILRDPAGVTKEIKTSGVGQYSFDGLRAGSYEITISREGFQSVTRALSLVAESRTVNVTLQLGALASSIDVTDVIGRGTASGMNIPNREVPSYVVSVTGDTLKEQGVNDLATALENVSGVITQVQYGAYEWYTIGGITQQSGNDFLYVDGMTLTGNRSLTQLNNIEEIQVYKGPNAILYGGSGAGQGGMINLIRKKPQARPTSDIQWRMGPWGLQELTGGAAGPVANFEKLLYRVDMSYSHRTGWRDSGSNRFNFSPNLTFLINPRMRVNVTQGFIRDRYTLDAGIPVAVLNRPGLPFDKKFNPEGDFQLSRDWQNKLDFTWNVTDRLTFNTTFFSRRNRDQYLDAEGLSYVAATDRVNRSILYYQHNRRPVQEQTELYGDYDLFGMRHRAVARYEYSDQDNYSNRTGPTPNSNNSAAALPVTSVPVAAFIDGTWIDDAKVYTDFPIQRRDYSSVNYHGVVLQDQFNPVKWLGFNFAMARRKYRRETHNDAYDNGKFVSAGNNATTRHNTKANYKAGVALVPQEDWPRLIRGFMPYFSYATSFNPVNNLQPDGTPLDPVINESFEVGNKWKGLGNRLEILTAVRRIRDKNRAVSVGGGWFEQVGTTTTYNGDIDITGSLGHGFFVTANYGYADGMIDKLRADGVAQTNGGKRFPHAPKHTEKISVSKNIRLGDATRLSVNLAQRYVYSYFLSTANTAIAKMPSRGTMDAAFTLFHNKYEVALNLENVLNKERYFVSQINGSQLYPGRPLNATMTIRYRFQ